MISLDGSLELSFFELCPAASISELQSRKGPHFGGEGLVIRCTPRPLEITCVIFCLKRNAAITSRSRLSPKSCRTYFILCGHLPPTRYNSFISCRRSSTYLCTILYITIIYAALVYCRRGV